MADYTNIIMVGISLLLQIAFGFILVKFNVFPRENIPKVNKFCFKLCFIPLMARAFALRDLYSMNFLPLAAMACMSVGTQLLMGVIFFLPLKDPFATYLSLLLPCVYINYVIIGIPLFNTIWGEENNAITSVVIMSNDIIIVPVYQCLSAIYHHRRRNKDRKARGEEEEKMSFKVFLGIIGNVFKSPIIQGIILGIIWSLIKVKLPLVLDRLMYIMASCVSGLALFCVGGFLSQHSLIACHWGVFIGGLVIRFLLMPLLACVFSYAVGLSATESRQCCALSCVTTAVAAYPMSATNGIGMGVSTTMIFWTTVLVVPVIIFWLWVLDMLGIFIEN